MFICQTPKEFCGGKRPITSNGLRDIKVHESGHDANRCYIKYLVNQKGYVKVPFSSRTLIAPDGSTALMLPKRHKPDLRKGKRGGKDSKGQRVMPAKETGGVIVG